MRVLSGVALLTAGASVLALCGWFAAATAAEPTPAALWAALRPVASTSLAALTPIPTRLTAKIPATKEWLDVVRSLGRPRFWVGPVTPAHAVHSRTYSRSDVPFSASVSVNGRSVGISPADLVPYGYSASDLNGYVFSADSGDNIQVDVATAESPLPAGEMVVLPVWGGWTVLDHANGALAADELWPYVRWAIAGGTTACLAGMAVLWSERTRRRRLATR